MFSPASLLTHRLKSTSAFVWWLAFTVLATASVAPAANYHAAVFFDRLPGQDEDFAREMAAQVASAGYIAETIGVSILTNTEALRADKFDLLVLPDARSLPASSVTAIESYLKQGGDLLALGLPAWDTPLFEVNGRWLSRASFDETLATVRPEKMLVDFAEADLSQWRRTSDNLANPAHHEIIANGGGRVLHVTMEKLTGWETYQSPAFTNAFAPGQTLTCFRARGTAHTKQLALEWTERDGSRWIATVDLTSEWKNYALPPEAFKAWQPPPSRSGKSDGFNPANAARFVVGLAHTHTAIEGVEQEYWLADLGTAANPFGDAKLPDEFAVPHLESVSPGYQFFPVTPSVVVPETLGRLPSRKLGSVKAKPLTPGLLAMHPRPRGIGFAQDRQYRWEPLLVACDASQNDQRGAVAALLVHVKPPCRGGVWAAFTPSEKEFYRQPTFRTCLQLTLQRMRRGVFLVEGGAEFFTTFPKQSVKVGARVANFGNAPVTDLSVAISFQCAASGWRNAYVALRTNLSLAPGQIESVASSTVLTAGVERSVEATLADGEILFDRVAHEVAIWQPKAKPGFLEARDGGLWIGDERWKAHGVNYMPSSGIGLANWQHFEHWVGRGAYDPEIIERDLQRIKAMNLNAVSVFIYRESLEAQHLLDFLRRCEAHDIHVNLSLRPGTPLDFRWNEMRELIEHYKLAENDTVFAYDLAWEPRHEAQQIQSDYVPAWRAWVQKRYANADAAKKAWDVGLGSFQFEFTDLKSVPAPTMKWFTQDGLWRKLIADYRLFLDEMLHEKYAEARRLVRSIDPHHPVSFRMQHAGDATFNWDAFVPYDFNGLAGAVDIWEPEAYGRIGDWEKVRPGRFTADYSRLCDAAKPVMWAEMGYSVWDNLHMSPAPEKLAFQAQYFRDFYRMMNDSAADGIFFWWYPGGYRLNERSDYGIINPDGTDRPVTKVIREEGAKFLKAARPAQKPDRWINVDRDRDARGLFGIYEAAKSNYWSTIAAGRTPGLKWESKPNGAAGAKP